jgi:hypothetical protein
MSGAEASFFQNKSRNYIKLIKNESQTQQHIEALPTAFRMLGVGVFEASIMGEAVPHHTSRGDEGKESTI